MINDPSTLNPGSNANDFQPTTQNPQVFDNGSLQTPATNVQPVQNNGTSSADQLYQRADRQAGLRVQTDAYSLNSLVSQAPSAPSSNNGLMTFTSALVILLLVVMIVQRYWRQIPTVVDEEPVVAPAPVVTTPIVKAKAKKKKRSKK